MVRNPFRKPYVFSKKWAIWSGLIIPFSLYTNLTAPGSKKSDVVGMILVTPVTWVLIPWTLMRISRALRGKSPQGKTYDDDGVVIEGEVLNLNLGYRPRVRVQSKLVNGVLEIPTARIAIGDIKSVKAKDPRPLLIVLPLHIFGIALAILYWYVISQPLILFLYLDYLPYPQRFSRDQMYEQLHTHWLLSHVIHSKALLQPTLIALSIVLFQIIVIVPFIMKTALVIKIHDGKRLLMPFSRSMNPYLFVFVERRRIKRFIKKVKKARIKGRFE